MMRQQVGEVIAASPVSRQN